MPFNPNLSLAWIYHGLVQSNPIGRAAQRAINTTGKKCFGCWKEFDNGEEVWVFECNGAHVGCEDCVDRHIENFHANPTPTPSCPMCRSPFLRCLAFTAQNYHPGSGTVENPITIED